jgi:hypothetical protein
MSLSPRKILNPATGKYVKIDGAIGKKLNNTNASTAVKTVKTVKAKTIKTNMSNQSNQSPIMYHIFGFNYEIPTEMGLESVPESEINHVLAGICREYCKMMDCKTPRKLILLEVSTAELDTIKLIKIVKELVVNMGAFCKENACDNKGYLINGIVKGGKAM